MPARPDAALVVVGDELVAGTGDPRAMGWVGRVAARTPQDAYRLTAHALGVPGETTTGLAARWQAEAWPRLGDGGRLVLGLGRADLRAGTVTARSRLNVANVLDAAAAAGLRCLVVGPPPVLPGGPDDDLAPGLRTVSEAFAEVCERRGVTYVDLLAGLTGNPDWEADLAASDGRLPGQAGYGLMAYLVLHGGWDRFVAA
ncbi:GDSL-type esterase/lipase family protein [Jannaschia sp. R86511]|uniref:GDSL-type esterase/lipase family protein n=1 Tax=Jannaschia sp. R86511 TaxID=3093853 RepID=UPI0036D31968